MSKRCIIVGSCVDSQIDFEYSDNDYIIASDGGYSFLKNKGYRIDAVIGDFDSLKYVPEEDNVIKLNPIKDVTDTHAAMEYAKTNGYNEFLIYGCIGGRIEHSFAIIQDAYKMALDGFKITLFAKNNIIRIIHNEKIEIKKESGFISVFSPDISNGVTLKNLKYEIENQTLTNTFPLGVSNEFINKKATIEVISGCLIIIY